VSHAHFELVDTLYPVLVRGANRLRAPSVAFVLREVVRDDDGEPDGNFYRVLLWSAERNDLCWLMNLDHLDARGVLNKRWTQKRDAVKAARHARYEATRGWYSSPERVSRTEEPALRAWLLAETDTGCGAPAERVAR
jgi:hypothetical protein